MVSGGQSFSNAASGERYHFLQTGAETDGQLVMMEDILPPGADGPIPHYHPHQSERFIVRSGRLLVQLRDRSIVLEAGQEFTAMPGTPHKLSNAGTEELHLTVEMRPALRFAEFLETAAALTWGENGRGRRFNLFEGALLMQEFGDEIKPTVPPEPLQRVIFPFLAVLGGLLGYRLPGRLPSAAIEQRIN